MNNIVTIHIMVPTNNLYRPQVLRIWSTPLLDLQVGHAAQVLHHLGRLFCASHTHYLNGTTIHDER